MGLRGRSRQCAFGIAGVIEAAVETAVEAAVETVVEPEEIEAVGRECGAGHLGRQRIGVECRVQDRRSPVREDR